MDALRGNGENRDRLGRGVRIALALALALPLGGCGAIIREEGRRMTERQQMMMRAMYDWYGADNLEANDLYALEDRLHAACLPLERHTYARWYSDDPITEHSDWQKIMSIFECGRMLDIICDEAPQFCRRLYVAR